MRAVLRGLGAVPIKRRSDHDGDAATADPKRATESTTTPRSSAMFEVLGAGGAIGIFPEGISHDAVAAREAQDRRGAARARRRGADRQADHDRAVRPHVHPPEAVSQPRARAVRHADRRSRDRRRSRADRARSTSRCAGSRSTRPTGTPCARSTPCAASTSRRRSRSRSASSSRAGSTRTTRRSPSDPRVVELDDARARVPGQARRARHHRPRARARSVEARDRARVLRHLVLVAFWSPLTVPGAPLHLPTLVVRAARRAAPDAAQGRDRDDEDADRHAARAAVVRSPRSGSCGGSRASGGRVLAAIVLPLSGWATLRVLDRLRLVAPRPRRAAAPAAVSPRGDARCAPSARRSPTT